jgi:hypothetical protein
MVVAISLPLLAPHCPQNPNSTTDILTFSFIFKIHILCSPDEYLSKLYTAQLDCSIHKIKPT